MSHSSFEKKSASLTLVLGLMTSVKLLGAPLRNPNLLGIYFEPYCQKVVPNLILDWPVLNVDKERQTVLLVLDVGEFKSYRR